MCALPLERTSKLVPHLVPRKDRLNLPMGFGLVAIFIVGFNSDKWDLEYDVMKPFEVL